jgi:hypothetical protein
LLALVGGSAIGSIALIATRNKDRESRLALGGDAGVHVRIDANVHEPDASVVVAVVSDADFPGADARTARPALDAGPRVFANTPDATALDVDGGFGITPTRRGVAIQVITKPEGANLYVGHSYRGPGGTTLEEQRGTKLTVECRLRGYTPGTVHLVFNGDTEYAMCTLKREKICIDGVHNPFDDCDKPGSNARP